MAKTHPYRIKVCWNNNRNDVLSSKFLDKKNTITPPPEFPKDKTNIRLLKDYLITAINGCLMTTLLAITENLNFIDFKSDIDGELETIDRKYMISEEIKSPIVLFRMKPK